VDGTATPTQLTGAEIEPGKVYLFVEAAVVVETSAYDDDTILASAADGSQAGTIARSDTHFHFIELPLAGITGVNWKDEGDGGPCVLWDAERFSAWRVAQGLAPDGIGIPFGSQPDGMHDLGWLSYENAAEVARLHGLSLNER